MSPHTGNTRLSGRWRLLLRLLWGALAVFNTLVYLAVFPQSARAAGQSPTLWLELALESYFLLLALFLFWQRSDDWLVAILSILLMPFLSTDNFELLFGDGLLLQRLILVWSAISSALLLLFFFLFPDGRFVPRWTRWAALASFAIQLWRVFDEPAYMRYGFPLVGVLMATIPVALLYRYYRASDPVQRQQIKWVVFSLALVVPPIPVALALFGAGLLGSGSVGEQIGGYFWTAFLVVFPLSIAISALRYRLWDIDLIIRKTLVYSVLSGLLALLYLGSVVLLQAIFGELTEGQSPLIIVLSTLLIAALFSPLRRRLQEIIDRRFYRRKYDAMQVLAQFAHTARDEVELDQLTAGLVQVVEETMRPQAIALWLKRP
jgi:hypothetical protein